MILLEVAKECGGGTYMTMDELAPYGDESVKFLVKDELFYHAGDLTGPTRPDSGTEMRQGYLGHGQRPDTNEGEQIEEDDDHMEERGERSK